MSIKIIKIGEIAPEVCFRIKTGANFVPVMSHEIFANKRVLLLGIPGVFWTDYPASMVLGYDYHYESILKMGVEEVYVTSTNDAYVMSAWIRQMNIKNIKPLPDGNSEWAEKTGLLVDMSSTGMGLRSHRYVMILENNILKKLFFEDFTHDPHTCFTETNAEKILGFLKENQNTWLNFSRNSHGSSNTSRSP